MRLVYLLVFIAVSVLAASLATAEGGVVVVEIAPGSASIKSGVEVGDVIDAWKSIDTGQTESAGEWLPVRSPLDLDLLDVSLSGSEALTLRVIRNDTIRPFLISAGVLGLTAVPVSDAVSVPDYIALRELPDDQKLEALQQLTSVVAPDSLTAAWLWSEIVKVAFRVENIDHGNNAFLQANEAIEASGNTMPAMTAWMLQLAGEAHWQGGAYEAADEMFEKSVVALGDTDTHELLRARAINLRGRVASYAGRLDEAERYSNTALDVQRRLSSDSLAVAETLQTLGTTAFWGGHIDLAEQRFRDALAIRIRLAVGSIDHGRSIGTLGNIAWRRGDLDMAEQLYLQAFAIHNVALPGSLLAAGQLTMLGHVAFNRRDFGLAENYYFRSLSITQEKYPGEETVANTLMGLGNASRRRFDLEAAREYHTQAKEIYEGLGARQRLSLVLSNLANVEFDAGLTAEADAHYRQSLAIREELGSSDLGPVRYNLAGVAMRRGDFSQARQQLTLSLDQFREQAPGSLRVQSTVFRFGEIELAENKIDLAKTYYTEALAIAERLAPGTLYEAESLHRLGKLALASDNLEDARDLFTRAITAFEAQRRRLGGNSDQQRNFAAQFEYLYKDLADVLLQLGESVAAFDLIERYRARVLAAIVLGRAQDVKRPAPVEVDSEWTSRHREYDEALSNLMNASGEDDDTLGERRERLDFARTDLDVFLARYRTLYPRRAAFEYAEPLPIEQTLSRFPHDTAVLSYVVTQKDVYLLLALPGDETSCYVLKLDIDPDALRSEIDAFLALLQIESPNDALQHALWRKGAWLFDRLVRPADELIRERQKLIVLADGPLHGLPLSALSVNAPGDTPQRFLIEQYQLQVAPSLHWLLAARNESSQLDRRSVAVFADPTPLTATDGIVSTLANERVGLFPPLPAARREAEAIAELFDTTALYIGDAATETNAKALSETEVSIVHFATHAVVNSERPLESFLVLRANADDDETFENGLLQAREIVEQIVLDADLVVLSACNTALGELSAGEGITGLTSSFLYVGARNVIATFWPVSDVATSEIMTHYYGELQAGESPSGALRNAQIAMITAARADQSGVRAWLNRLIGNQGQAPQTVPAQWAAFQLNGSSD